MRALTSMSAWRWLPAQLSGKSDVTAHRTAGSASPFRSRLPEDLAADIKALYEEFVALRPEIVHAWLDWDNVRAGIAAVLAGVPTIILSGRNLNPKHFQFYRPYMDAAYRVGAAPAWREIEQQQCGWCDRLCTLDGRFSRFCPRAPQCLCIRGWPEPPTAGG